MPRVGRQGISQGCRHLLRGPVPKGTTPGVWRLQAWAETTEGLALDPTASETKSVTFTSLGSARLSNLVFEVKLIAKSTNTFAGLENQGSLQAELADVTAHATGEARLGGLAYALGQAKQDEAMIVFPADSPPVTRDGVVVVGTRNDNDLVIDPNEWTGDPGVVLLTFHKAGFPISERRARRHPWPH